MKRLGNRPGSGTRNAGNFTGRFVYAAPIRFGKPWSPLNIFSLDKSECLHLLTTLNGVLPAITSRSMLSLSWAASAYHGGPCHSVDPIILVNLFSQVRKLVPILVAAKYCILHVHLTNRYANS